MAGGIAGLVLAGGVSSRFVRSGGVHKVAIGLGGRSLLCYPVSALWGAGVERVVVVSGVEGLGWVYQALSQCRARAEVAVYAGSWRGNGATAVSGLEALSGYDLVVVSMADHVYPGWMVESLLSSCSGPCLGVDSRPRFVDVGEATRVALSGGRLVLGKGVPDGLVDVGLHLLDPSIAGMARRCSPPGGEMSLAELLTCASRNGYSLELHDYKGAPWAEADTLWDALSLAAGKARPVLEEASRWLEERGL